MFDWIGWLATAVFTLSYLCKQPHTLRRFQGLGALLWLAYGALIHSMPVIGSNLLVAAVALGSSLRERASS
jgi:hypothetical protein